MERLMELTDNSPFRVAETGGTFVKPFADFQLNKMIESNIIAIEQLRGLQILADEYPEISGSIYAILEKQ